ncbi:hypothetical protein [Alicyclobacillus fastidiosus]|uniref:hypothetical protein n=1 Tax=Alicyclobacillus fastidiosus TaxID=392011 RepID=UPI0023E993BC|nr:hypothetical protein [Alicyclobacillus fastidiosus]GMA65963.1 hypothetical protein GCM10025859_64050 [Alicyclobacillus fastidiosus]GMA66183.1 hypothetical protein GCM10025859_66250 [Alicyclobacillus fastidiosus]
MKPQKRSSKCETVNLGVSFNLLDPHQAGLYQYAKDTYVNFSAAVKRWLENEMRGVSVSSIDVPLSLNASQSPREEMIASVDFEPKTAFF